MQFRISNTWQSFTNPRSAADAVSGFGHDPGFTLNHCGGTIRNPHVVQHKRHIGNDLALASPGRYIDAAAERPGNRDADADHDVHHHGQRKQRHCDGQHHGHGESDRSNHPVHSATGDSIGGQQFSFDLVDVECDISLD